MNITAKELINYFKEVVDIVEKEKDYLCDLDRKLGDGDHGVTMSIGWQAVNEQLNGKLAEESDCGKISSTVGMTFLNAVGSSVGPLYATGFMRGGKAVKGKSELNDVDLAAYWIAFINGVQERGNAKVGDKTMMDTLIPALEALVVNFDREFIPAFESAVEAGEIGMKSTTDLVSKIGRSSRLGERSKGAQDPGATSAHMILKAFLDFAKVHA
ncbi:dihydroxyacetone kinase subunit L [Oceanobacillus arenosus]|uniref:phosphoenolpyruvate--glycerone phosphotransferase n=1 Tax=Oceanobacillus arenosus TaxID=1229153 RepID=A0A3D8Q276_9BACI|nr:dihydroxyacetone kinase subunit DhaL [Oceanobacillus arenosus]RDW22162.1 dihydroxyacetone kinase subunit L [Oceanobacillus arenosus]